MSKESFTDTNTDREASPGFAKYDLIETSDSVKTAYGTAKIYGVSEDYPSHTKRVLVVPGFSETINHNKKLVKALGDAGYDASTFSQPRGIWEDSSVDTIYRQAEVLLAVIEATTPEDEKINLAAHSFGGPVALQAARIDPKLFKRVESLTLMQPMGMTEDQNLLEQLSRVGKKVYNNQTEAFKGQELRKTGEKPYAAKVDIEARGYAGRTAVAHVTGGAVLAKNLRLAYREARAAGSYTQLAEDIKKFEAMGIPVNLVTSYGDEMFDLTTTTDDVKGDRVVHPGYSALAETKARISTIADRGARHDAFWQQPRRTAEIIRQLIDPDLVTEEVRKAIGKSSLRPQFFDAEVEAPVVNQPEFQSQSGQPAEKATNSSGQQEGVVSGVESEPDTQNVQADINGGNEDTRGEDKPSIRSRRNRRTGSGARSRRKRPEPSAYRLHGTSNKPKTAVELAMERADRGNMTMAQEQKALSGSWIPEGDGKETYKLGDFERKKPELPDDYAGRALLEDGRNIKVLGLAGAINGVRYYHTSEGVRTENQLELPRMKKAS